MNQSLETYLNHHLHGFSKALVLLDRLASREPLADDHPQFRSVRDEVAGEFNFLRGLIESADLQENKVVDYRKLAEIPENEELHHQAHDSFAHLEMLEALVLTIQSKRLLWKALEAIQPQIPGWKNVDFSQLERSAIRQRDGLEARRLHHVHEAFWTLLAQAS
ncbi:MAG: hypothetical protein QM680_03355 [Luteolibacter sp.]